MGYSCCVVQFFGGGRVLGGHIEGIGGGSVGQFLFHFRNVDMSQLGIWLFV